MKFFYLSFLIHVSSINNRPWNQLIISVGTYQWVDKIVRTRKAYSASVINVRETLRLSDRKFYWLPQNWYLRKITKVNSPSICLINANVTRRIYNMHFVNSLVFCGGQHRSHRKHLQIVSWFAWGRGNWAPVENKASRIAETYVPPVTRWLAASASAHRGARRVHRRSLDDPRQRACCQSRSLVLGVRMERGLPLRPVERIAGAPSRWAWKSRLRRPAARWAALRRPSGFKWSTSALGGHSSPCCAVRTQLTRKCVRLYSTVILVLILCQPFFENCILYWLAYTWILIRISTI